MIPGTSEWLLARVNVRVEIKLRKELRRLQREMDATVAGLWVDAGRAEVLVEFAGEIGVAPERCPYVTTTVPTFETFVGADGTEHDAVVHRPRLGRAGPGLRLLVADAALDAAARFDAVAASGERIEEILVAAL